MSKIVELKEETDFTTTALADRLNEVFGSKKTGKPFTLGDIEQYGKKYKKLPDCYGGNSIEIIENKKIGIKVLRVVGEIKKV